MTNRHEIEYTDTFGGEANYSWVKRAVVTMPELTHYGYDGGTNYAKANKVYQRELMKRAESRVDFASFTVAKAWIASRRSWGLRLAGQCETLADFVA